MREDPRLPLVSIYAGFRGGLLAENLENNGITRLLSRTLLKGTKNRTAVQIAEQIESAGGRIGSDNGNNSFSVSVEVMKPDLALGLEVLADVLENPTFRKRDRTRKGGSNCCHQGRGRTNHLSGTKCSPRETL